MLSSLKKFSRRSRYRRQRPGRRRPSRLRALVAEQLEQRALLTAGTLDADFSGDGFAITSITDNDDTAQAVAALDDGSLVAAGRALAGDHNFDFALVKHTESGQLDTDFGEGGTVQVDFGKDRSDEAFALEVLPDGKMLVGGYTNVGSKHDIFKHDKVFALARLNPDGTLDSTFGDNGGKVKGVVITDLDEGTDERINDIEVQDDGKIVAVGRATGDIGAVRYHADGSLDTSFGNDGIVLTDAGGFERDTTGLVIQSDGKITVSGSTDTAGSDDLLLAQYTSDGSLDSQFGSNGLVLTDFQETERANDVALQNVSGEDRLVVTGDFSYKDSTGTAHVGAITARYMLDGTLDQSFGNDGFAIQERTSADPEGIGGASALTVDASERIVIASRYWNATTEQWDFAVLRYTSDGAADTDFGQDIDGDGTRNGVSVTSLSDSDDQGRAVALDPDGRIVVAGWATDPDASTDDFAVARYLAEDVNSAPSVTIANPDDGDTISGTIDITANASDSDGTVEQVEFFVDGSSIGIDTDGSDGWSASWDTTQYTEGDHTVTAEATDDGGATGSDSVGVVVDNNDAPTVSITDPTDGATVSDTITVTAEASDSDGTVEQVEFFVDGGSIGVDTDGSNGWSASWDTTQYAEGDHTVTAEATDDYTFPETAVSDPITVTVDNVSEPKFYVPDDSADETFQYDAEGGFVASTTLAETSPRGATANTEGTRVWVVDGGKAVSVYDGGGTLLGTWNVKGGIQNPEGIATDPDGQHIWIVDAKKDEVAYFEGGGSFTSGNHGPSAKFALDKANGNPTGLTTDDMSIWVADDASTDAVFKYDTAGSLQGSWTIDGSNSSPTGITIDPSEASNSLWIADSGADAVFEYADARKDSGGSLADSFALAAGNTNPQGIADPPVHATSAGLETSVDAIPGQLTVDQLSSRPGSRSAAGQSSVAVARDLAIERWEAPHGADLELRGGSHSSTSRATERGVIGDDASHDPEADSEQWTSQVDDLLAGDFVEELLTL